MKKNILAENMRRFGTMNLHEDGDQNNNGYPDNTEGYTKFRDIQPGEYFLRFGTDGQLWQKISDTKSKFIKNVGKKTAAKGTDAYKHPRIFSWPATMEVTRVNK